ncbi:MAG: TMEM175 family protein, partial [Gemmatimonadales bacterium]
VPFTTRWMSQSHFAPLPTSVYGIVLLLAGVAYAILQGRIIALDGRDSRLARAVGGDAKGYASLAAYSLAIPLAFVSPWISCALYAMVALIWLIPDPRIEHLLNG